MLILQRDLHQRVIIGNDIIITIVQIEKNDGKPGRVKIGIEAPKEIPVHREEVYQEIQAKRRQANET